MTIEMTLPVDGVDRHNDTVNAKVMPQHRIGLDREQNRRGIRETSRLHNETIDAGNGPSLILIQQAAEGSHEIVSYRAADTAIVEKDRLLIDPADEVMIETDFAKLIDQHRGAVHRLPC
jgi:hypothetical protein